MIQTSIFICLFFSLLICLRLIIISLLYMLYKFCWTQNWFQVLIYLDFVEIPESVEEKKWKNRVEKVSQAILKQQMEEGQGLAREEDLEADEEGEDDEEGEVEEGEGGAMEGGANNGDKKPDGWVEDPDSDIMDAKVMMTMTMTMTMTVTMGR